MSLFFKVYLFELVFDIDSSIIPLSTAFLLFARKKD